MAELDYAYLAEYAQVIDGKLTAVNASFIHVKTRVPTVFQFAVAGRVRAPADAGQVTLAIKLAAPDKNTITWHMDLSTTGLPAYNGKVGILFALRVAVPLATNGLYAVAIDVDDQEARQLAFEAVEP